MQGLKKSSYRIIAALPDHTFVHKTVSGMRHTERTQIRRPRAPLRKLPIFQRILPAPVESAGSQPVPASSVRRLSVSAVCKGGSFRHSTGGRSLPLAWRRCGAGPVREKRVRRSLTAYGVCVCVCVCAEAVPVSRPANQTHVSARAAPELRAIQLLPLGAFVTFMISLRRI